MKNKERVLVTQNRPQVHNGVEDYIFLSKHGQESWHYELMSQSSFVERWMAEQDSSILQLIPYVVCITEDGKILSYQRKGGGEGRLEGKHSIGIGGHVNDQDLDENEVGRTTWTTVKQGAIREVVEELEVTEEYAEANLIEVGSVYTPSDDGGDKIGPGPRVGEVHLGVLYVLRVTEDVKIRDGEGMIKPKFVMEPSDISKYEEWSQKALGKADQLRSMASESS